MFFSPKNENKNFDRIIGEKANKSSFEKKSMKRRRTTLDRRKLKSMLRKFCGGYGVRESRKLQDRHYASK